MKAIFLFSSIICMCAYDEKMNSFCGLLFVLYFFKLNLASQISGFSASVLQLAKFDLFTETISFE